MNKNAEEILLEERKHQIEEINREIEIFTKEVYEVVNSSNFTLEAKKGQIDSLAQRIIRLLEGRSDMLGRPYHTEVGPFIVQISRLKDGLIDGGESKAIGNSPQTENLAIPISGTSKTGFRRPFLPEKNKKYNRQRGLQNLFIKPDEALFPVIAKAIGLNKNLKDYQPGQEKIIINLQKRFNPKIKKYWGMMLSSTKRLSGGAVGGLRLIRTNNS